NAPGRPRAERTSARARRRRFDRALARAARCERRSTGGGISRRGAALAVAEVAAEHERAGRGTESVPRPALLFVRALAKCPGHGQAPSAIVQLPARVEVVEAEQRVEHERIAADRLSAPDR